MAPAAVLSAALDGLHVASADGGPDATLHVRYATEHRAGVLLRGAMLCDRITGTGACWCLCWVDIVRLGDAENGSPFHPPQTR